MKRLIAVTLAAALLGAAPADKLTSKLQWRSIGPYIGGRVVAVAGVPTEPGVFYMGAVQGGVWRSTNYGLTWENITDGKLPMNAYGIGALAVAPSNPKIIYAGTGEADIRQDFAPGDGIYKTMNEGKTWTYAGLRDTHMTTSLVIDPRDSNVVYATSMGHVFKPNPERGVFKTTDGGKTWKKILFVDDTTGAAQVVMDAKNPNVLYASMWQAQRTAWGLTSGGPGSGLYKSTDAGANWTKISTNPGFARGLLGKIGVAVSASNPNVVYAIVQAKEGGVFRSADAGATWKRMNGEDKLRQRAFYYMAIFVDPKNSNVAFAPQVDGVYKTTDAGKTWKALTPPGDHHIIWVNPRNTNIMLLGNDGGAQVSVDGGNTWSTENNQPTGQFYHVALDDQFPFHVYGAQQDEGAYEGPSASNEGLTLGAWHTVAQGESTFVAPQPGEPGTTYGSGYYSYLARLNTPTGELKNVSPWPLYQSGAWSSQLKYRWSWTHPIFFSPVDPHVLFEASQVVMRSDDYGQTWKTISPDLTRNDKRTEGPSGGPISLDETNAETFPDISALAVSPLTGDVMWAGSADGLVHVTTDAGAHWQVVTAPQMPQWAQISSIEPSHVNRAAAYLTANRYMWDDFHPYVYMTTDYGAHWTQITRGLPSGQFVFVIRQDPREPRLLFAGTRSTVYASYDGGAQWQPLSLNLPYVQVRDLAIDAREGELVAATHGRSFWILDNLKFLEQLCHGDPSMPQGRASSNHPEPVEGRALLFAPENAWLTHAYGGGASGSGSGDNPDYGAAVFFNLPSNYDGKTPVSLSFEDASGKTVRSFSLHLKSKREKKPSPEDISEMDDVHQMAYALSQATAVEAGMNLFRWDMRYAPAADVPGFHLPTSDDITDSPQGPTILPGTYTAVLTYGGQTIRQSFDVAVDPRLHPATDALAKRLALAMQIRDSLNSLDTAIDDALAARAHASAAKRAQIDRAVGNLIQLKIQSSEGDVMNEVRLRTYLGFLMNELDTAYQAPTQAEYATYDLLRSQTDSAVSQLHALIGR
ncbi:MAG TPA: hypothetical protein VKT72_17090 [Candidatus Baltobacteraceae bacterium]|nr:hypothetical protein [Candidatus Baltobacteraceae bacterium]